MEKYITTSEEMISFGENLAKQGSAFLLHGILGAGKTTITKGIASGLGIDPATIQSPTYTYLNIYEEKLLHIDMRRIENEKQLHTLGLLDLIQQYPYVVIERPKREYTYADTQRQEITIQISNQGRICTQKNRSKKC